jgi:hypothetical protein
VALRAYLYWLILDFGGIQETALGFDVAGAI